MLTHLVKSINWIDVILVVLFIRLIFVGVKSGFVAEFFKTLGIIVAVFVSLHYYSLLAAWIAQKTHPWKYWEFLTFSGLWVLVVLFFKLVKDGALFLFKVETNHEGFNKYAAGIVAIGHGLLVCSMTIFLVLLALNGPLTRMTLHSFGYRIAGGAAVGTYSFLYTNVVAKFSAGEHYNKAAPKVLHPDLHSK